MLHITAVNTFAILPEYSFTILSRTFRMVAIIMPPHELIAIEKQKRTKTFKGMLEKPCMIFLGPNKGVFMI